MRYTYLFIPVLSLLAGLDAPAQISSPAPGLPTHVPGTASAHKPVVASSIQVKAVAKAADTGISSRSVSSGDVLSSAGTYGDFEKYLQILPGVVFNSDQSDDVLVRGGNPAENLYLVDGIEVPDINHITGEGTTGGFTSMLDTASIRSVDFRSGAYSAAYAERLSSIISIHTLDGGKPKEQDSEAEAGYVGLGGHTLLRFGSSSHLLLTVHRSLLNLFTRDIGLDGVPIYTNGLVSGSFTLGASDAVSILSLSGQDSINITPSNTNVVESNTIQTQYSGWRTTNGIRWQHGFSRSTVGVLTGSDSEQSESVAQQDQAFTQAQRLSSDPALNSLTEVYSERTHDGIAILQYELASQITQKFFLEAGSQVRLNRIHYTVEQPSGQHSPFSADTAVSDAVSFAPQFSSGQSGSWAELTIVPARHLALTAGTRLQTYAAGGVRATLTPRLRAGYQAGDHHSFYAALGEYAQQPAFIYLESFAQNRSLLPIRVQHLILGTEIWKTERTRVTLEAYRKNYWAYPVASEYPQLSLANMVDTLGQQFVWLPLSSRGHGHDYGAELAFEAHCCAGLFLQGTAAYARAFYSGEDGVYRRGNFDYPVVVNLAAIWRSPRHYEASTRYEYTTGRPYTPFQLDASVAQDRGIYDLSRVNGVRGPAYSRLDIQLARIFRPAKHETYVFGGIENTLNRQNFLGYAWTPHCSNSAQCRMTNGAYTAVPQIGLYPNFGARVYF